MNNNKHSMMYGYARVSTPKQLQGTSLKNQKDSLYNFGCDKVFAEQYTGTKKDRPEFDKLKIVLDKGDTVVIARLDRLSRNMTDMLDIIRALTDKGVKVITLKPKMTLDPSSSYGRAMIGMFATFAQLEHDMICDRMNDAKKTAIANGNKDAKGGRPSVLNTKGKRKRRYEAINDEFKTYTHLKQKDPKYYYQKIRVRPAVKVANSHDCSVRTVYNIRNAFKYSSNN